MLKVSTSLLSTIFQVLFFLAVPGLLLTGERKGIKLIKVCGVVVLCYIIGISSSYFPFWDINLKASNTLTEITVPLAIPLMLFSLDIKKWVSLAKSTMISFSFSLISITLTTTIFALIFKDMENIWAMTGMIVGVYTGGTPNMAAIGKSLDVPNELFVILNTADIVISSFYILFMLTIAQKVLLKFLPAFDRDHHFEKFDIEEVEDFSMGKKEWMHLFYSFLLAAFSVGASVFWVSLVFGNMNLPFIILSITSFGILFSFNEKIRSMRISYYFGQYLLFVFCLALGSMIDLKEIANVDPMVFLFVGCTFISSILVHFFLCWLARIDADTALITNVAAIYGPPFVGPVAEALKNPYIVVSGLTSGLVGYAIGNYLGISIAYLVKNILGL